MTVFDTHPIFRWSIGDKYQWNLNINEINFMYENNLASLVRKFAVFHFVLLVLFAKKYKKKDKSNQRLKDIL